MFIIRNAKIEDIPGLIRVKRTLSEEHAMERIKRQREKLVDYLLLEDEGEIVSFVLLKWHGKSTHPDYPDIEDLFTREDQRGKGFGTKLITECEKLAREKGFSKIGLAANPDSNEHARKLYEKLGYSHDGKSSYVDGVYNGVEDWCIDLEKNLD